MSRTLHWCTRFADTEVVERRDAVASAFPAGCDRLRPLQDAIPEPMVAVVSLLKRQMVGRDRLQKEFLLV